MKGQHGLLWTSKGSPTNLVIEVVGQFKGLPGPLQVGYLSHPICLRGSGWENEEAYWAMCIFVVRIIDIHNISNEGPSGFPV